MFFVMWKCRLVDTGVMMKKNSLFTVDYAFSFSYSYYYGYGYFVREKLKHRIVNRKGRRRNFEGCQPNAGGLFYEPAFLVD